MFNFNWKNFTEKDYKKAIKAFKKNAKEQADEYLGFISVGELKFDVIFRDYSDDDNIKMAISYDCYVLNEDTGYGYTNNGMPYDYADGTDLYNFLNLSYQDFVSKSEELLTRFINENEGRKHYSLVAKAAASLSNW